MQGEDWLAKCHRGEGAGTRESLGALGCGWSLCWLTQPHTAEWRLKKQTGNEIWPRRGGERKSTPLTINQEGNSKGFRQDVPPIFRVLLGQLEGREYIFVVWLFGKCGESHGSKKKKDRQNPTQILSHGAFRGSGPQVNNRYPRKASLCPSLSPSSEKLLWILVYPQISATITFNLPIFFIFF